VGTRRATEPSLLFTTELATALVRDGWCVWSGGAYGIDFAAHAGALAAGGVTVVVTAGGLDDPYPPEHGELYRDIVRRGGCLVSLQPDGARRRRHQFLQRNYDMAALSSATIVTEMPLKSGAMYTASAARTLAKPLLFVPHAPWSERGGGSARAIAAGAQSIASVDDALTKLRPVANCWAQVGELDEAVRGVTRGRAPQKGSVAPAGPNEREHGAAPAERVERGRSTARRHPRTDPLAQARSMARKDVELGAPLAAAEKGVFAVLDHAPTHIDSICEAAELPFARVSRALLTLTLHGLVVEGPSGHYGRPCS